MHIIQDPMSYQQHIVLYTGKQSEFLLMHSLMGIPSAIGLGMITIQIGMLQKI